MVLEEAPPRPAPEARPCGRGSCWCSRRGATTALERRHRRPRPPSREPPRPRAGRRRLHPARWAGAPSSTAARWSPRAPPTPARRSPRGTRGGCSRASRRRATARSPSSSPAWATTHPAWGRALPQRAGLPRGDRPLRRAARALPRPRPAPGALPRGERRGHRRRRRPRPAPHAGAGRRGAGHGGAGEDGAGAAGGVRRRVRAGAALDVVRGAPGGDDRLQPGRVRGRLPGRRAVAAPTPCALVAERARWIGELPAGAHARRAAGGGGARAAPRRGPVARRGQRAAAGGRRRAGGGGGRPRGAPGGPRGGGATPRRPRTPSTRA